MKTYRITYTIKGSIIRPYYAGSMDIKADIPEKALSTLYQKLKIGTFPEINRDDLIVQSIRKVMYERSIISW